MCVCVCVCFQGVRRTSSARSPGPVQPSGDSQSIERRPEEKPRGTDRGGSPRGLCTQGKSSEEFRARINGNEAAGGFPLPESGQGVASGQVAPKATAAAWPGRDGSAGQRESLLEPETPAPEGPAPSCQAEVPAQDFTDNSGSLGAHPPAQSSSEAAQEAQVQAASQEQVEADPTPKELPWDSASPAPGSGAEGSGEDTEGASDAQGCSQTRRGGAEPGQGVTGAADDLPKGTSLLSPEPSPCAATQETGPASSFTSQPAAPASAAAEQPSQWTREMVSGAEMPTLTDPAGGLADARLAGQEKHASEGEGTERGSSREVRALLAQEERGEGWNREQSQEVQQGVLAPTPPSASDESARRSPGPKDEAKAESPAVAKREGRPPGPDPTGQEAAPESPSADPGTLQGQQPEAYSSKPHPEVEKDGVSQLSGDVVGNGLPSTASAQPLRKELLEPVDGPRSPSEDAAWSSGACGMMGEAQQVLLSGSLHQLHEQDPAPGSGQDGAGEPILPEGAGWEGPGLPTQCPATLQDVGGLGRMDSLPALESEKSDVLSPPATAVTPKAQEVESMSEIKRRSHPSAQRPGSCDGQGLLTAPQPWGLGCEAAGPEVCTDGPLPREEENLAVDCGLMTLSLEQDQQGNLSCLGDSGIRVAASEKPSLYPENQLQASQTRPEASILDMLGEKSQHGENEKETHPGAADTDSPQSHICVEPPEDVSSPVPGGKEQASESELGSDLPKGSLNDAPNSASGDTIPENSMTEQLALSAPTRPESPVLGENVQEGGCGGSQPSRLSPPAADTLQSPSLAGSLSRKEGCCAGQGLNKSQQELTGGLNASSQHEEACLGDAGLSEAADARPPLQGLAETEKASENTVEARPGRPDSVALLDASHCLPAPAPASPRVTPAQDAREREACDEAWEDGQPSGWAPQKAMEHPTASEAEVQKLLGSFPSAEDQAVDGGSAETGGGADGGDLGTQRALEEPEEAARSGGFLQTEPYPSAGEEASTPALGEPCQVEQPPGGCQDAFLPARELGGISRSRVDTSAAQAVPEPKRLLPSAPPEEAAPDTPYLHIAGAAGKEAEDSGVKAVSSQGPGAPGESPCSLQEPLLVSEKALSVEVSAGSLASLSQPEAADVGTSAAQPSSGGPRAGNFEGPVDSVPCLDRMPLLAKEKQTTGEEKDSRAPGVSTPPSEIPACPASEESTAGDAAREMESSRERAVEPSKDPRKEGASAGVDARSKQTRMMAGFTDFREHITKIFETSVLGVLTAERPQSNLGEKAGAGRSVMGKDLPMPSLEKLPDGTQGVTVAPLPTPLAGIWVDSKAKKQESAVEAEVSRLGPQDPAPEKLPGLAGPAAEQNLPGACVGKEASKAPWMLTENDKPEGAGEGWPWLGGQAPSEQESSQQESALGLPSQVTSPEIPISDLQVAPQGPGEGDSLQDDRFPSDKQETSSSSGPPREDGAWGFSHPRTLGDMPLSTAALEASFPSGDVPTVAEAISEPGAPDTLRGERRHGSAAGISETQNALDNRSTPEPVAGEVADTPLEPGLVAGAAGEAEGDVTLSTAETGARVSDDLPETGTTRRSSGVACASALPGSRGDPGGSEGALRMEAAATLSGDSPAGHPQAEEQPGPELPASAWGEKVRDSSSAESGETRDLKLQNLNAEALEAERYLKKHIPMGMGGSAAKGIPTRF
uniref:Transforming acidic coiled-coil containing protein 2 n=1 Tax=Sus scrofa TaxID=9823 RepID=A0A8D1L5K8_PIG